MFLANPEKEISELRYFLQLTALLMVPKFYFNTKAVIRPMLAKNAYAP